MVSRQNKRRVMSFVRIVNEREIYNISFFINVTATGAALLIDKSDTTNYPHTDTNNVIIHSVTLKVDKASNVLGNIGISLVTDIDATNSKIYALNEMIFTQNNSLLGNLEYKKTFIEPVRCTIDTLKPGKFITNDFNLTYTHANTATSLVKPIGSNAPADIGDILVNYALNAGTGYYAIVEVEYSTE